MENIQWIEVILWGSDMSGEFLSLFNFQALSYRELHKQKTVSATVLFYLLKQKTNRKQQVFYKLLRPEHEYDKENLNVLYSSFWKVSCCWNEKITIKAAGNFPSSFFAIAVSFLPV